jgi:hypothetical protein
MRLTIEADWNVGASGDRSFNMTSIFGDRRFSGLRVDGNAAVDHVVEFETGFDVAGQQSTLTATAGSAETEIEVRAVTRARYSGRAARLLLIDGTDPLAPDVDVTGAVFDAEAPPDVNQPNPPSPAISGPVNVTHFDTAAAVAGADGSDITDVQAGVAIDLPQARGTIEVAESLGGTGLMWIDNQGPQAPGNPLQIAEVGRVAWVDEDGGTGIDSVADSFTNPTDATRTVSGTATAAAGLVGMIPVTFIPGDGPVIQVTDLEAEAACEATADTSDDVADASWSLQLEYWVEDAGNDGLTEGAYSSLALTDDPSTHDQLATLFATPPVVWEEPDDLVLGSPENQGRPPEDIYLFPVSRDYTFVDVADRNGNGDVTETITVTHQHRGYLADWGAGVVVEETDDAAAPAGGRNSVARVDRAFSLTTQPLDPTNALTAISASMGSVNCQTRDLR